MAGFSRRDFLAGACAVANAPMAAAEAGPDMSHPGYRAWTRPRRPRPLPLDVHVDTGARQETLRAWLGGRPAVLALWATWCGPCLREKPAQAAMARRLAARGARARILALQSYDDVGLAQARTVLAQLGAGSLVNGRSMPDAEAAFIDLLGASSRDRTRTSLPWLLLIDSGGRELGRALGLMAGADGVSDYWEDEAAFELLSQLA